MIDVLARMRRAVEPGGDRQTGCELVMTNPHGEASAWQGDFYRIDGANPRKRLVLESPDELRGVSVTVQRLDTGADRYGSLCRLFAACGKSRPTQAKRWTSEAFFPPTRGTSWSPSSSKRRINS